MMEEGKKDKDKMPISWYLGGFGLAFLTVGTYFGLSVLSEDPSSSWPAIITVIFVVVLLLLILTAMYAKRQDEHSTRWKIVGYLCIAVYIAVAVFFSKPFCKFVYVSRVIGNELELQYMANKDIDAISAVYDTYESQRNQALSEANQRLTTYSNQRYFDNNDFDNWVKNTICGQENVSTDKIKKWYEKSDRLTKIEKDISLKELSEKVNNWDYDVLSSISHDLKEKIDGLQSFIEDKIAKHPIIPIIEANPYKHDNDFKFSLNYPAKSYFAEALSENNYPALGIIIYVVLHLMVLICWAVAKGTNVLDISDQSEYMKTLGTEIKKADFFPTTV